MVTYKREVGNRKKNIETDRRNSERNWKKIKAKNENITCGNLTINYKTSK